MNRDHTGAPRKTSASTAVAPEQEDFDGFPAACFEFLAALERHNDRRWFNQMREPYERQVLLPTQAFVTALEPRLREIHPHIVCDARVNGMGSMFRLARDTRFSKDKTPYKTNLGFRFWLSPEAREAKRVGLYMHVDKSGVRVYGGAHQFMPDELAAFRDHVALSRYAATLRRILVDLAKRGYTLEAERMSRVPRGYAADHPNADLLVYKSLFAVSSPIGRDDARSPRLIKTCVSHAAAFKLLNNWFAETMPTSMRDAR